MSVSGGIMPFSSAETKKIKAIQFGLLNPEDIVKMSVAKIDKTAIVDSQGRPLEGGINDLRMGTVDKQLFCKTCQCNFEQCPGHFGHIELAKPVYHVGFIEECRKILKCICFNCSKLLLVQDQKYAEVKKIKNPKKRQAKIYNLCKTIKECKTLQDRNDDNSTNLTESSYSYAVHDGCGYTQPKYNKDKSDPLKILIELNDEADEGNGEKSRPLSAEECLRIFQKISDEDCRMLGFDPATARPDWMIIKYLAVCPPQVRPSVSVDASLRSEDDLTFQYSQILKTNQELINQDKNGASGHQLADSITLLQFYVATLMNNEISSGTAQQRSGRPIKAISTRLKGKEGRLRGNLMGKRVDFSARSVISPDPNLQLDELGVPLSVAMNLTFPEAVTPMNIDYLRKLVENGPTKWPGAKYIIRDDGVRIDLRYIKNLTDIHLAYGYIVERHMKNGDFVVFNRQPSLHKMSMMGHRVHVLPYSTFRLNLSVTTPYNADFDGDEMNMHLPQSYETKAEIVNIMHVPKQIVSPQSNKPVMGIVQDTLIGVKLFTHRDNFITFDQIMNLVMWVGDFDGKLPVPAILKPQPLWTGKQIFSLILPKINLVRFTSNHDEKLCEKMNLIDSMVQIDNGELIQGIVCKRTVGNTSGGLIHCIWNEFGPTQTMNFLSNCQKLVNNWMLLSGFTVGVSDIISDNKTNENIRTTMEEVKKEVRETLVTAQQGKLECQPGKGMIESFESKANNALNKARETAGNYVQQSLKNSNHLKNMVLAGSKGNVTNISQIIACVGQQNVEGKRIPFHFNRRTLPHFIKDDYGPESRGFVENSYLSGLTPQEFYFHAMGGREGIIDTAVKTSETGYIQRRLVKALEDVMVKYDGTVRNSVGNVIQFLYGEDGMAGELIEDQKIETLNMDNKKLKRTFMFFDDDDANPEKLAKSMRKFMERDLVDNIVYSDDFPSIRYALNNEFKQIMEDRDEMRKNIFTNGEDKQHFPVNIPRIIWNAKKNFNINMHSISDLHPMVVLRKIEELKHRLILVKGEDQFSKEAQSNALKLFTIVLNYNLSCKRIIQNERINTKAFDWIIGEIESRFFQAIVRPGEMVGNIAAQSIGEPATQMTLNTFHFAGVSAKNVTLGVPRLKEVINVAKRLKTPSMTIYLKKEFAQDQSIVKKIHSKLEHTTMMNITAVSEIYYDPDIQKTIIPEDQEMIDLQMQLDGETYEKNQENYSPWVLRLELDYTALIDKDLVMETLEAVIQDNYKDIDIIRSEDNAEKNVIRIRIIYNEDNKRITKEQAHSEDILKKLESSLLKDIPLVGIPSIKKVYVKNEKKIGYDPETGAFQMDKTKNKEWVIETDGTNMFEVFQQEEIDFTRVLSNDINEIYDVLGIEAVRKALINEVRSVLRPYDIYVNYRHICILCDVMTQRGILTSITRHGLNRAELGPIRKCSFEETVEILLEAGLYGERDYLTGITENILVGQLARLGTGSFDLLLDLNQIENAKIPEENKQMEIDEEIINTPINDSLTSPQDTPYAGVTPSLANKPIMGGFTPNDNSNAYKFTPAYNSISSPSYNSNAYRGDSSFITTPNPINSIRTASPVYNPHSDYYKTPGPYSPLPFDESRINSDYVPGAYGGAARSPSMMQSGSVYYKNRYQQTSSPVSHYSPTTPALRPSSSSPAYIQGSGIYSSTPRMQESGGSQNQYSPMSPSYNPMSPRYNVIPSTYSRNSPYYNPTIGGAQNNQNNDNNNQNEGQSPIQSDDEGEKSD